jgi:hypothetical protein
MYIQLWNKLATCALIYNLNLENKQLMQTHCKLTLNTSIYNLDALPSPGVNPLEGSPMWSCGIGTRKGAPDFQHYKGVKGRARSLGIRLGRGTSRSSLILHPKQTTK